MHGSKILLVLENWAPTSVILGTCCRWRLFTFVRSPQLLLVHSLHGFKSGFPGEWVASTGNARGCGQHTSFFSLDHDDLSSSDLSDLCQLVLQNVTKDFHTLQLFSLQIYTDLHTRLLYASSWRMMEADSRNVVKLGENAEFELVSCTALSTTFYRIQVLVKTKFILKTYSFLIANDYAVHGHI